MQQKKKGYKMPLERNFPPIHPGEVLKEMFIDERGLSYTEVAEIHGIHRAILSAIIKGQYGISAEMAIKLSKAFGTTPQFWINLQKNYELFDV